MMDEKRKRKRKSGVKQCLSKEQRKAPTPNSNPKCICFRANGSKDDLRWYVFNPCSNSDSDDSWRTMHVSSRKYLYAFAALEDYPESSSFVTLGSSFLYCIGGFLAGHNQIFTFPDVLKLDLNFVEDGWNTHGSLINPRHDPCTMVMDGKIYVFDGFFDRFNTKLPWAEVYDPNLGVCLPLPNPPLSCSLQWGNSEVITAPLFDEKKILVGFRLPNTSRGSFFYTYLGSFTFDILTDSWEVYHNLKWMDFAFKGRQAIVVDKCMYWYDYDHMHAYDLDQDMWYAGNLKGLESAKVLLFNSKDFEDRPWLLHLEGGTFVVASCEFNVQDLGSCIHYGLIQVSKSIDNGEGILNITLKNVQSYILDDFVTMFKPCMMDGIFNWEDNSEEGSASGKTNTNGQAGSGEN